MLTLLTWSMLTKLMWPLQDLQAVLMQLLPEHEEIGIGSAMDGAIFGRMLSSYDTVTLSKLQFDLFQSRLLSQVQIQEMQASKACSGCLCKLR